ncbi:hypothetical protein [Vibrio crassostreae]|uniref:hypothetical protein n=1 Tax=Vibrio crassostreae TaxID=246167 RepID=UPI001405544F|nr:hypothetical protein [Vibrio crassostreae]
MSKPSLANANFKRFMRKPELRIEKAQSLYDLLGHTSFGVRCHMGKLLIKVENGYLVEHQYTQGQKDQSSDA